MAVDDIYRVTLNSVFAGQTVINVLNYNVKEVAGIGDSPADLAAAVDAAFGLKLRAATSALADYQFSEAQKIFPVPVSLRSANGTNAGNGNKDGPGLPPADAVTITKLTEFGGRAYRGRMYLGGLAAEDFLAGDFDGAIGATYVALAEQIKTPLVSLVATYQPIIYTFNPATPEARGFVRFITDAQVRRVLRTQRRRQVGIGI